MKKTTPKQKQAQRVLQRLVLESGSWSALARKLGIGKTAVTPWKRDGFVPLQRLPTVQRVFGLHPWEVRPDLFRPPSIDEIIIASKIVNSKKETP